MPKPRSHFAIKRVTVHTGKRTWLVSGTTREGDRQRRYFADRDEAERHRQQLEFAEKSKTQVDTFAKTRLTQGQVADAEMAYKILEKLPIASLSEAIDWCSKNYVPPQTSTTVQWAFDEMMMEKAATNRRQRTVGDLRARIGKIAKAFGGLEMQQVTTSALSDLIPRDVAPKTRNNYISKWTEFFNWGIKRGYLSANPAESISKSQVDAKENVALTLSQTKAVLKAAHGTPIQSLVALQLFAGLRNDEAKRLDWAQVDMEDLVVKILPGVAKKRNVRTVELERTILPWLDMSQPIVPEIEDDSWEANRYRDGEGGQSSFRYRRAFEQMRADAKITDRKYDNVLRHTALSFYAAKTQSLDKTIHWAGTGVKPFFDNYKSLVKLRDVDAYWSLTPESLGLG